MPPALAVGLRVKDPGIPLLKCCSLFSCLHKVWANRRRVGPTTYRHHFGGRRTSGSPFCGRRPTEITYLEVIGQSCCPGNTAHRFCKVSGPCHRFPVTGAHDSRPLPNVAPRSLSDGIYSET